MKTDELVLMLANGAGAVEPNAVRRRLSNAMMWGTAGAIVLMVGLLGVRPDLGTAVTQPAFWGKIGFVAALTVSSLVAVVRLAQPGVRLGWVPGTLSLPVLVMWGITAVTLVNAEPAERLRLLLGQTWAVCPFLIALLSGPVFAATFSALKDLAPTRLTLAGAAAGLLSGATGALVYSIHCPEMDAPFLGTWYVVGILIPALTGALVGRRLLRW